MTAVNEVVSGEDLNWHSKNALKQYVPNLLDEDIGKYWNRRVDKWLFSRLQSRIEDKAAEHGISVEYVHPHYTSKTCHACQHIGYRPHQGRSSVRTRRVGCRSIRRI
ncbi:transposase [Haloferax mediterranei ATCC 33500]|uniref:IS1341-type transposase n=1 Tax=Haloferax mediterranei (strain ATCC 33500 / DSM 1411 / JCM 8866 / NBRC 14739 / NCIMB 2177 / R-4) TaxID=523841 RepID=I3R248_HALMT|nr:zinc ribbon domain-containing protein [Haloferax mediterranei]AFK18308.1 putative IS1341-type transposase [Haloferax mediterranei ATCC 33500]AHZ22293.1 transposase [Haloferax mediterranei ATCC 33500]EMA02420.1 putative IS1341-type transposase [Haloferax mediterranei ATCC 33500]MDX5988397.1 zinc ribbon domain-containing protein [Haloferax mediterranei ATCC 33500]QCQ74825.1 transposase [Haloferax mediterranei ATCC 33500]